MKMGKNDEAEPIFQEAKEIFMVSDYNRNHPSHLTCLNMMTWFYIDIGVKHPDRPGEYLMGIECDGASYHSARSVRDRDRLRQEILESEGWCIHRIWSTSWFHTRSAEIDRLKSVLEETLDKDRRLYTTVSQETESEVVEEAHHASASQLEEEEKQSSDFLEEALHRFWQEEIQPRFPDRSKSILSEKMVNEFVKGRPITENQWFVKTPQDLRVRIDPKQRNEFLDDILNIIDEYD